MLKNVPTGADESFATLAPINENAHDSQTNKNPNNRLACKSYAKFDQVPLNVDPEPIVVNKKPTNAIKYTQNIAIKFLKPPELENAGDILIVQEKDVQTPPLPPQVVRQKPPIPAKPAPVIIREAPPLPPTKLEPEYHVVPGKVLPPPPRKVIVEKLPEMPQPPPDIIVERWLDYPERIRRVIYQPATQNSPPPPVKNVHIIWDTPAVAIQRQYNILDTVTIHPAQYVAQYGPTLVHPSAIPAFVQHVRPQDGQRLAAENYPKSPVYVGNVQALHALNLIYHRQNIFFYGMPQAFCSYYGPNASSFASSNSFNINRTHSNNTTMPRCSSTSCGSSSIWYC